MPFAARQGFIAGASQWAEVSGGNSTSSVTIDGANYIIHTFTNVNSTQTFTVNEPGIIRILAVGGGGSGGDDRDIITNPAGRKGGGGGAGEFYDDTLYTWDLNGDYTGGTISIDIGRGGEARQSGVDAQNGYDTTVGSLTVKGGGGGAGLQGGSGGGGMAYSNRVTTGATSNISNSNGKGNSGSNASVGSLGGGGGGAGAAASGGDGGNGLAWVDGNTYAGGGGGGDNNATSSGAGGDGGTGGGGYGRGDVVGGTSQNPGAGTGNTGGGGGAGFNGGSGVVKILVRSYA